MPQLSKLVGGGSENFVNYVRSLPISCKFPISLVLRYNFGFVEHHITLRKGAFAMLEL